MYNSHFNEAFMNVLTQKWLCHWGPNKLSQVSMPGESCCTIREFLVAGLLICSMFTNVRNNHSSPTLSHLFRRTKRLESLRHSKQSLWQCDEDDSGCCGFCPWPSPVAAGPVSPGSPPGPGLSSWPTSASSPSSSWHYMSSANRTWMSLSFSQVWEESLALITCVLFQF